MGNTEQLDFAKTVKAMYQEGDYHGILALVQDINTEKIKDRRALEMIADSYDKSGLYNEAREHLLMAYERFPGSRSLAYKLSVISVKVENLDDAVDFYEDFCRLAPNDNSKFILKYLIGRAGGIDVKDLIKVLEQYNERESDEKWLYELARLYHEIGRVDDCVALCDEIALWYAGSEYEKLAFELKFTHKALSTSQQARYEQIMRGYAQEAEEARAAAAAEAERMQLEAEAESFVSEFAGLNAFPSGEADEGADGQTQPLERREYIPARKSVREESTAYTAELLPDDDASALHPQKLNANESSADETVIDDETGFAADANGKGGVIETFRLPAEEIKAQLDGKTVKKAGADAEEGITQRFKTADLIYGETAYAQRGNAADGGSASEEKLPAEATQAFNVSDSAQIAAAAQEYEEKAAARANKEKETVHAPDGTGRDNTDVLVEIQPQESESLSDNITFRLPVDVINAIMEETRQESREKAFSDILVEAAQENRRFRESTQAPAETGNLNAALQSAQAPPEAGNVQEEKHTYAALAKLGVSNIETSRRAALVRKPSLNSSAFVEEPVLRENVDVSGIPINSERDGQTGINLNLLSAEKTDEIDGQITIDEFFREYAGRVEKNADAVAAVEAERLRRINESVKDMEIRKPDEADFDAPEKEAFSEEEVLGFSSDAEADDYIVINTRELSEEDLLSDDPLKDEGDSEEFPQESLEAEGSISDNEEKSGDEVQDIEKTSQDIGKLSEEEENAAVLMQGESAAGEETSESSDGADVSAEDEPSDGEPEKDRKDTALQTGDAASFKSDAEAVETAADEALPTQFMHYDPSLEEENSDEPVNNTVPALDTALENFKNNGSDVLNEADKEDLLSFGDSLADIITGGGDTPALKKEPFVISPEFRREIREFLLVDGIEEEIRLACENIANRKLNGDASGGNMIITGDKKSGKTYLAIAMIKAVIKATGLGSGKVVKVQAQPLNGKNIHSVLKKVDGRDLIIENVSYLKDETIRDILDVIKSKEASQMIVFEGNSLAVENILMHFPDAKELFGSRVDIQELTITQWAQVAKEYAAQQGYSIDDMADLALHARIDRINVPSMRLGLGDIKDIVDSAIVKASRRNNGRLFAAFSKKGKEKIALTESDFIE